MSDFTTWRSLVDGEEIGVIPDSAIVQLDARDSNSITQSNGEVTGWGDRVTGETLTGTADGLGDINGHQAVTFDHNESHGLDTDQINPTVPYTAFVVVDLDDAGENRTAFGSESTSNPTLRWDGEWQYIRDGATQNGTSNDSVKILTVIEPENTGEVVLREDGSETSTSTDESGESVDGLAVGYRADLNDRVWSGEIGFLEIHGGEPDGGLESREQEIADEWDIDI